MTTEVSGSSVEGTLLTTMSTMRNLRDTRDAKERPGVSEEKTLEEGGEEGTESREDYEHSSRVKSVRQIHEILSGPKPRVQNSLIGDPVACEEEANEKRREGEVEESVKSPHGVLVVAGQP